MSFWRRPQATLVRRALVQVHLWTGVAIGLYVLLISITGAALLFRIDMQRALDPALFPQQTSRALVAPGVVLDSLERAYPAMQIAGIDAPTDRRPSYLAYVMQGSEFVTVLLDPVDGRVLGALPARSFISTLQGLHFNLLAGDTGRVVNGAGAMLLLLLAVTGAVIWWQGASRWSRGLKVKASQSALRVNWELHSATGFWALLFLLMWAITGLDFAFPQAFRASVNALSPLSAPVQPKSRPPASGATPLSRDVLIARAIAQAPDRAVARVVVPSSPTASFQVLFAKRSPARVGETLSSVYLDQYSGAPLLPPSTARSIGDVIMSLVGPLHTGSLGGWPLRVVWFLFGLAPALLFITGFISWWTRVVRPRQAAL
jgi:uncharacterized iron-regulated membrane protein